MPIEHLNYRRRARGPSLKRWLLLGIVLAALVLAGGPLDLFAAGIASLDPF